VAELYPISAVAKLTSIPLDTLRAWERRYGVVVPKRVARGRLYSTEQVKRLQLLRRAVDDGHSIGQVAGLADRQLRALLAKTSSLARSEEAPGSASRVTLPDILSPVLQALERFDYAATDQEINRLVIAIPNPRDFVHQAALPLMHTIGQRWHDGKCSIAQEHILTRQLTAILSSLVRNYSPSNPSARVLFATPQNERHEFPILAAAIDIVLATRRTDADAVLLSLEVAPSADTLEELSYISRKVPREVSLWLGGRPELRLGKVTSGSRWQVLEDYYSLEHQLAALAAGG
jgi:DNA-binding transcriptional MerR regulator